MVIKIKKILEIFRIELGKKMSSVFALLKHIAPPSFKASSLK